MFILKNNISNIIKKERAKEKAIWIKIAKTELAEALKIQKHEYESKLRQLRQDSNLIIKDKDKEIAILKNELNQKYKDYQQLRLDQKQIGDLSAEFALTLEEMAIKIHESIQPFYRTRAKIETVKRKSDKDVMKNLKIFRKLENKKNEN